MANLEDLERARLGHLPASWPSYEERTKALCGKELEGVAISEEEKVEDCIVCRDLAANIAQIVAAQQEFMRKYMNPN